MSQMREAVYYNDTHIVSTRTKGGIKCMDTKKEQTTHAPDAMEEEYKQGQIQA